MFSPDLRGFSVNHINGAGLRFCTKSYISPSIFPHNLATSIFFSFFQIGSFLSEKKLPPTLAGFLFWVRAYIYSVSQEECARIRKGVPYVKLYRYNPKHLCPKLNGYGNNGQRKMWYSGGSKRCTCQLTSLIDVCP